MSFNSTNLTKTSSAPNLTITDSNLIWYYTTTDSINTIDTAGGRYFDDAAIKLVKGDIIRVTASDGVVVEFVTSSNRGGTTEESPSNITNTTRLF